MRFMIKSAVLLAPVLALATPAFAAPPPNPDLNDPNQPGSAIVFPKFVNMPRVTVDGVPNIARTEIELGAVCPSTLTCLENTKVKIRAHWVCPGAEGVNSNICNEEDFDILTLTVNGKVVFAPDGIAINSNSPSTVRPAPCPRGYLIAWVVNTGDQPVKFDALIGNAVIRGATIASTGNSGGSSAYNAIPIQANIIDPYPGPTPPVGGPVQPVLVNPLDFDGAAGGYQQLTDVQTGDVRFDKIVAGGPPPDVLSTTFLTFLTLDVASGLPNNPVFLDLVFYNENEIPTSIHGFEFVCWTQVALAALPGGGSLTQQVQTTRKGIVVAGPAQKVEMNVGDPDSGTHFATLIGLVETEEGTVANNFEERKYNFNMVSPFVNGGAPDETTVTTTIVPTMFRP